jgi:hypothetical protein
MSSSEEVSEALAVLEGMVAVFQERAFYDDPDEVLLTIKRIVGAISNHGKPPKGRGQPARGVGLDFRDALVVASIPEFDNSLTRALKSYYPHADEELIKVHAKRIRKHLEEIAKAEGEF